MCVCVVVVVGGGGGVVRGAGGREGRAESVTETLILTPCKGSSEEPFKISSDLTTDGYISRKNFTRVST